MTKKSIGHELWRDLRSPLLLPALFTGLINGILLVFISVSFAAMIFSGAMAGFASRAAGLTLFGTAVMGVAVLFLSGIKTHTPVTQDAPTATLIGAMPAAAALLTVSDEAAFMTLAGILFLSALVTGGMFVAISRFQLANLFRFVPYPVVGGFLAGTGWLLTFGGIGVMCGLTPTLTSLGLFLTPELLARWLPGVLIALGLFAVMQRHPHPLVLPLALLVSALAYYAVFGVLGISPEQAREAGFLISGLPDQGLWPAFSIASLSQIHWDIVFRQIPLAFSVALVSTLGMLLNTSGVEVATAEDIDLDHEFKALGIANLIAGAGGSVPGYTSLALTLLGVRSGAVTRLGGVVSTLILVGVLGFGGRILAYFPQPLLGALLMFLGLFFLWDWVVLTFSRMPRLDYALILIITLVIAWQGFLFGVAAGMAATLVIFVIRFSRVSTIFSSFDLTRRHSHKQRPVPDQHLLAAEGRSALGYELSGYLFFGSASAFVETVRARLCDAVGLLLIDFSRVSGFDISADSNFQRLLQSTSKSGIQTVLSACPPALARTLHGHEHQLLVTQVADLDAALEQGEELLLKAAHQRLRQDSGAGRDALFDSAIDEMMQRLERLEWCESLVERLKPFAKEVSFAKGEALLRIAQQVAGLMVLISGNADELSTTGSCCRDHQGGAVLYPQAQFGPTQARAQLLAASAVQILCLAPCDRRQLEVAAPALALELDRYIMSAEPTSA